MQILVWAFRGFVFFALFAFALNNQQEGSVEWFFGYAWRAPMVFIVLAAFALGLAFGIVAMMPGWWRHRRAARRRHRTPSGTPDSTQGPATDAIAEHPPRDGI